MQTLKFKTQPTNAFFGTVNQMSGDSSQLPITTEHCFVVWTMLNDIDNRALGSGRKLGGAAEHLIDGAEKRVCCLSFEC